MNKSGNRFFFVVLFLIFSIAFTNINSQHVTQGQINEAIEDGLSYLAGVQGSNGAFYGGGGYYLAQTAAAVLAFTNEGHFPGSGTEYSDEVERGFDFIFNYARLVGISNQPLGNPDSDGDGKGVYFHYNSPMYETGMVMQSIIASNTPDRVVTTGPCIGMTYREVMVDLVDWLAYAQNDYPYASQGRGGWHYVANQSGGDNSTCQWPVLGLVAAQQWDIHAPDWVKDELHIWVDYIQNTQVGSSLYGGSGYNNPTFLVNVSKTGGLLVEHYYLGYDNTYQRAEIAVDFIESRWNNGPSGTWYGNMGHPYAMFSVFKGLELMEVHNLPTSGLDWWQSYADYLVNNQEASGRWYGYGPWRFALATGWNIVILQATVFPIQLAVELPDCACDNGYEVMVDYSIERFPASGTLTILKDGNLVETITLTDFQGNDTFIYTVESDSEGDHTWSAELNVTGGGIQVSTNAQDVINICESPVVAGIPDQTSPFQQFDLDDYLTNNVVVNWSYASSAAEWTIAIDSENIVTVESPEGAKDPIDIIFTATSDCCNEVVCVASDTATFTPNRPPIANAGEDQTIELETCDGSMVELDGSLSTDPDGDALTYAWTWDDGSATGVNPTVLLPLGETTITLVVNDGIVDSEPDEVIIVVEDTTPPTIVVSNGLELWPPNHKYEEINLSQFDITVSDLCMEGMGDVYVYTLSSDEAENAKGKGDGNTVDDMLVIDCETIKLRKERAGNGNGRVYTVQLAVEDAEGNIGYGECFVSVPHSKKSGAVNDGIFYTVDGCDNLPKQFIAEQIKETIPDNYSLQQNYPNPFNPTTTISFGLPQSEYVKLAIYNSLGEEIQILIKETVSAGIHTITFDASDLNSGIYFYSLVSNSFNQTRKMILLR